MREKDQLIRLGLHVGDYLRETRHLSACEHGAYLLLIMHYWSNRCLPQEEAQLAAIASMSRKEWRKHRATLAALFEPNWKLSWLEVDIADALEARRAKSAAGKRGNSVRWGGNRHAHADRLAFGERSHCDPNAIAMRSLPLAAGHREEPDQGRNTSEEHAGEARPDVVPFIRRIGEGSK